MPGGRAPVGRERVRPSAADGLQAGRQRGIDHGLRGELAGRRLHPGERLELERGEDEDRELLRVVVRRPVRLHGEREDPLAVGVPEMTPFAPSVTPGGSEPLASVHELRVPFAAVSAGAAYAWPMFASGRQFVATNIRARCGLTSIMNIRSEGVCVSRRLVVQVTVR